MHYLMTKQEKQYWADYYGISPDLPDDEFMKKINEINNLALEEIKKYDDYAESCKAQAKTIINEVKGG